MNPVLERKPWDVHSGVFAVSAVCLGKRTTAVNGKRQFVIFIRVFHRILR